MRFFTFFNLSFINLLCSKELRCQGKIKAQWSSLL